MKPISFYILATLALVLNLALTSAAAAADPVPFGSAPPGLSVGSQYRLIVITTGTRDASSTLIGDYNSFATTEANATPALAALGTTWTAVASTFAVDARDNTGTNRDVSTGVPFYGRNGLRLAADNLALWSASNGTPNTLENLVTDGNGNSVSAQMWTGTGNNGDGVSGPLGQGGADWGTANSLSQWITGNNAGQNPAGLKRFYAMSGMLVVVATASTVTTPTSTAVTVSSATLGGNVTSDGGAAITERGVVYSLTSANADPLVGGSGVTAVTASGTTGMFTAPVSGLSASMDYSFKAYATNSAGTSYTSVANFTTNFAPTDLALTPSSIAENNAANATVGTLSATDTVGDTHLFTLAGGTDVGSFTIVGAALKLTPSADFETKSSYAITVRATDQGGLFFDKSLTVTISNANETPSFTKGANQSHHNGTGAAQSVSGWATALNDGDSTVVQTLTFNITGNTNAGLFTTVPAVSSAGVLTYTPNGTPGTATISVTLRDDATINGNAALTTAAQTFTITVQTYSISTTASMSVSRQGATATLLANGKVLVAGGGSASAELYDPVTGTWTATGSMSTLRNQAPALLLPNGKVLVAGGLNGSNVALSSAELYDPATGIWSSTGSMTVAHDGLYFPYAGALLKDGRVLITGGVTAVAELYDPSAGTWTATGSMSTVRNTHTATVLANGKVLVTAGRTGGIGSELVTAEVYDPATGVWTATGSMTGKRSYHSATLLPNGKVLAALGYAHPLNPATAELYDPVAGTWSSTTNNPPVGREYFAASLLPNGKVLIIGGGGGVGANTSLEVFDPATGLFTAAGTLAAARAQHTATMLANGKVLIAGGGTASAELYEVAVSSWANTGSLGTARNGHSTTLLPNGKVLVTGGYPSTQATPTAISEVYDPALGTWTVTGSLNTARYYHTAILLRNGKVLVAGGDTLFNQGGATSSAELYDPSTGIWTATGVMNTSGEGPLTMLSDGKVLFSGRNGNSDLYDPATGLWIAKGVITSGSRGKPASALPNGKVLSVGNSTASLYDPATGLWTVTGTPVSPSGRADGRMTLLPNGKILLAAGFGNNTCELYNPATGTWATTGALTGRNQYGAGVVLLPNGKVLHAGGTRYNGGSSYESVTTSALYDPVTGVWTQGASLPASQGYIHPGVALLPNGKVLFPGGGAPATTARLFDPGLGFSAAWQPVISTFTSPLISGGSLALTGTGFRGVSGASSGGTADSSSDHPVVQLRSMENPQFVFLHATNWSDTACTSDALGNLPPGWMMVTAFVNGIPSKSSIAYFDSPEMDLRGNSVSIADGDTTPSTADHTDFGNALVTTGSVVRTFTISNSAATLPLILTGTPSVSVSGTHGANFSVSLQPSTPVAAAGSTTFQVTFVPSATGLRTATLTIASNDSDENPYDIAIQGTGAANTAPTNITLAPSSIAENNAANATVGTLSATDANAGDAHTFTLASGAGDTDNGSFTLAGSALVLTPSADYETKASYAVRVRATDLGGLFFEKAFTITITDLPETPIEFWRQANFSGVFTNTGNAANTANPDSDANNNLLEFGFGMNPNVNDSSALEYAGTFAGNGAITKTGQPIIMFESSGNGVDFRALFVRRKDYVAAGLTYTPQFSARMTTWQSSATTPTVLADDGTYQIVSVPYPAFIAGQKARFFQIAVSIP